MLALLLFLSLNLKLLINFVFSHKQLVLVNTPSFQRGRCYFINSESLFTFVMQSNYSTMFSKHLLTFSPFNNREFSPVGSEFDCRLLLGGFLINAL